MKTYRYPGAKPFELEDKDIFFGRDTDKRQLTDLVLLEKMVLLYAKSGLGKSSLVNAGVIPLLAEESNFQPITVRFYAYNPDGFTPPLLSLQRAIQQKAQADQPLMDTQGLAGLLLATDTLWHLFKARQVAGGKPLALFFDQFEELFTYPAEYITAFKQELAELFFTKMPQALRDKLRQQPDLLTDEQLNLLYQPIEVRSCFIIRSDRMSLLNQLRDYIPNILRTFYELKPLTEAQATEAILYPAHRQGEFLTPTFEFDGQSLGKIITYLTEAGKQSIETFQLQILLSYIETEIVEKKSDTYIEPDDLGNLEDIFQNYYESQIHKLPPEAQTEARKFVEEQLIQEERRISLDKIVCLKYIGEQALAQLVNAHLIRLEPNTTGGFSYELSHDTLVNPILQAKQKREEEEKRIEEEREAEEQRKAEERKAQAEAEAERQRLAEERKEKEKQLKRQRTIIAIVSVAAVISLALAVWAFSAQQEASQQTKLAKDATEKALNQEKIARDNADQAQLSATEAKKESNEADSLAKIANKQTLIAQGALAQAQQEKQKALTLLNQIALAEATSAEIAINQFEFGKALQHLRNASISQDKAVILKVKTRLADYLVIGIYKYPPQEWGKELLPYVSAFRKIESEVQVNFEKKGEAILMADFEKAQQQMSLVRGDNGTGVVRETRTTAATIRSELIKAMTQKLGKEVMQPTLNKYFTP